MDAFVKALEGLLAPGVDANTPTDYFKTVYAASTSADATKAVLPANRQPTVKMVLIGAAILVVLVSVFWAGAKLSKGFPAMADPGATPSRTADAAQTRQPSETPSKTPTLTLTPPPTDTPTPTITSTPPCWDMDVSGFWIGNHVEILKDYAKSQKINCGTYSNPSCDKTISDPILLTLTQNGCDIAGQYGTGSSIFSFKPACDIHGSIIGNTITFPLQSCLFTNTAARLEFFAGKLVDELNGGLPVCKNQSTGTYAVTCYIHLERVR